METFFTLKLEADGAVIRDIVKDGLRIAKLLTIEVETQINGVDVIIHPTSDIDEIIDEYKAEING